MKNLGNLSPAKGSVKKKKRIGRGIGSGTGKTSGKGHKGQKARKSAKIAPGFEGGQTPLYRRLPKRGFTNINRVKFDIIHLEDLNCLEATSLLDNKALFEAGLVNSPKSKVKILARGKLEKSVKVKVHGISKTAKEQLESQGGSVEIVVPRVNPAVKKVKEKKK